MTDKKTLRREMGERISSMPLELLQSVDEAVFMNLTDLPELRRAVNVFVYWSCGREIDTHRLIEMLLRQKKTVALPLITGAGVMEARIIRSAGELIPGALNIPAPPASAPLMAPGDIDVAVVPGLAFDKKGYRLGRGGGYYDRYLPGTAAFTVGLCRECCLERELPAEDHDVRVDCVVTEKKIARLTQSPAMG